MRTVKNTPIESTLLSELGQREVVRAGVAPAVSLAVAFRPSQDHQPAREPPAVGPRSNWVILAGAAGNVASHQPTTPNTPFDLASITKPFVALTAARLIEQGRLSFETELGEVLPELAASPSSHVTLEALLSHRAGLEAHLKLYQPLECRQLVRPHAALLAAANGRVRGGGPESERLATRGNAAEPAALYSDLSYLLVGALLERVARQPLDELVAQEIAKPLQLSVGSARQWLQRSPRFPSQVAPTEVVPWRGGLIRGLVHDENAWALAGHGLAGHAGLFGTGPAVAELGMAVLDGLRGESRWLSPGTLQRLLKERPNGSLRAGFEGRSASGSSAGSRCSPNTFGHLGFTGTSFWCDPASETVAVLFTNRVSPSREGRGIREIRPRVNDALFALADAYRRESRPPFREPEFGPLGPSDLWI